MSADTPEFPTSITFTPTAAALTFYGGDTRVWLTISPDGVMAVGPGLSEDEATQRVAAMLAHRYSQLHKDQADALAAKDIALSEITRAMEVLRKIIHLDDTAKAAYGKPYANLNGVGLVDLFDHVGHPFGKGEHKQQPYRSTNLASALNDARSILPRAEGDASHDGDN